MFVYSSAAQIAEEMVKTHLTDAPCEALPKVDYLARNANYARQRDRSADPVHL